MQYFVLENLSHDNVVYAPGQTIALDAARAVGLCADGVICTPADIDAKTSATATSAAPGFLAAAKQFLAGVDKSGEKLDKEPVLPKSELSQAEQIAATGEVIVQMVVADAARTKPNWWKADGTPEVVILSQQLGYQISAGIRNMAYQQFNEQVAEAAE